MNIGLTTQRSERNAFTELSVSINVGGKKISERFEGDFDGVSLSRRVLGDEPFMMNSDYYPNPDEKARALFYMRVLKESTE